MTAVFSADGRQAEAGQEGQGSRTQPVVVLEAVLVPITDDDERRALEALIELLVPLFTESQRANTKENQ